MAGDDLQSGPTGGAGRGGGTGAARPAGPDLPHACIWPSWSISLSAGLRPGMAALVFYLFFVPAVALQWQFNANACVLNNLESWLRSGQWRDPSNREEGAWLATLCRGLSAAFGPGLWRSTSSPMPCFWRFGLWH